MSRARPGNPFWPPGRRGWPSRPPTAEQLAAGADGLVLAPTGGDWQRQVDLLAAARAQLIRPNAARGSG